MDCMACGGERYCALQGDCVLEQIWNEAAALLDGLYESVTFEELARRPSGGAKS